MTRSGSPMPNNFIYPHVLKACDGAFATGSVHAQVVETALVDSYARTGDSVRIAREMFDEMSERTVVSWTAMISGYARIGQIDEEQGAHKTPGCSWVEVNNRLHQFYSLDLSHCRSVEIYAMLDSLAAVA
ncbi:hypothetical protein MLD38_000309 [Melastoma candidum]|uniref:Uncharacterized protein n=1 Tax=Melastoma candidum TaxID=119954 RepID=A0ACB9SBL8_9MYRT|nr:hypothetical protein MLD38_000309 [Melastoma candidum]